MCKKSEAYAIVLGAVVSNFRTRAGLTQQQLAVMTDLRQSTVSRIESGGLSPTPFEVRQIAEATGATDLQAQTDGAFTLIDSVVQVVLSDDGRPWWERLEPVELAPLAAFVARVRHAPP